MKERIVVGIMFLIIGLAGYAWGQYDYTQKKYKMNLNVCKVNSMKKSDRICL